MKEASHSASVARLPILLLAGRPYAPYVSGFAQCQIQEPKPFACDVHAVRHLRFSAAGYRKSRQLNRGTHLERMVETRSTPLLAHKNDQARVRNRLVGIKARESC